MEESLIELLRQLLPDNEAEIANLERIDAMRDHHKARVVVCGTYNAGKSSLLNALTNHYTNEFFRVNDIPETREETVFESGQLVYVDTPGLDVNVNDDKISRSSVATADLLLIVHRLSAGSLQDEDVKLLQRVIDAHVNPANVLFVLTGAEQQDDNIALIDEITALMDQLLKSKAQIFLVSNPRYLKGMREGKAKLVSGSGIPELSQSIEGRAANLIAELEQDRQARRRRLINKLIKVAKTVQRATQVTLTEKMYATAQQHKQFVSDVNNLKSDLGNKIAEYNKLA
nr:GTPase [uncultured Enterobacter sp.]